MMRYIQILLLIFLLSGCAQKPPEQQAKPKSEQLLRAQHLYACFYFFSTGKDRATDATQKEKLHRISTNFLTAATVEAVAADGDKNPSNLQLEREIGARGKRDFQELMTRVNGAPTSVSNTILDDFVSGCSKDLSHSH